MSKKSLATEIALSTGISVGDKVYDLNTELRGVVKAVGMSIVCGAAIYWCKVRFSPESTRRVPASCLMREET